MNDHGLFRECLVLFPAWCAVVHGVTSYTDPRDADPQSVFGSACAHNPDRLTALLYWEGIGNTIEDARAVLGEVLAMAQAGRRPRYGRELGVGAEEIREHYYGPGAAA